MDYIALLIVGIIMLSTISYGYKKGVVALLYTVTASVLSILVALFLVSPVASFLEKETPLYTSIEKEMKTYVGENIQGAFEKKQEELTVEMANQLPIPEVMSKNLVEGAKKADLGKSVGDYVSTELSKKIVYAIAFMIVFAVLRIALAVLAKVLNIISRLPIINEFNHAAGCVLGGLEGIIIVWVLCVIVTAFGGTPLGQEFLCQISSQKILSFIYDMNPLMQIFFR